MKRLLVCLLCPCLLTLGCGSDPEPSSSNMTTNSAARDMAADQDRADMVAAADMTMDTDIEADASPGPDMGQDQGGSEDMAQAEDMPADEDMTSSEDLGADLGADMACSGDCTYTLPGCSIDDVQRAPGNNWFDSYSVGGACYCDTTFDHDIGGIMVDTPVGMKTVREVCEAIGPGPGRGDNPVYNDIQCGNGPANDAGDEDWCPGRVDQGEAGCCTAGPKWDLENADW